MTATSFAPVRAFYCFDPADQALCKALDRHLAPLKQAGRIQAWGEWQVLAGSEWEREYDQQFSAAHVLFLLISPDSLASETGQQRMQRALRRRQKGEAVVIPVLVRPCAWEQTALKGLQILPRDHQALTQHANQDDFWQAIVKEVRRILDEFTITPASGVQQTNYQSAPHNIQPLAGSLAPASPPGDLSTPIFFVNMSLTSPREFYGRDLDRAQLLGRTLNNASTSIVGPRRSGKTWLMTYLRLVAAEKLGPHFCIGYLSAALPSCTTRAGFTGEALKALGHPSSTVPASSDLRALQAFVEGMGMQKQVPVLCIDEFESLTHYPAEFNFQFFEGLRAIAEIGLSLVVLSKEPLIDLVSASTRTSPFFNIFLQLTLASFERAEAERFVQEKGTQAQFSKQERAYMLDYSQSEQGQFPPLRLQLVGEMLLNEKQAGALGDQQDRSNDPEYWQAFKERVDAEYKRMVRQ